MPPRSGDRAGISGAPGRIRTCDLNFRKVALYPSELRVRDVFKMQQSTVRDYERCFENLNAGLILLYPCK
jgi:hypothetical protein